MSQMDASRRPAMKIEEAALLPALPRHAGGPAALGSVMRAAEAMRDKQVGNSVEIAAGTSGRLRARTGCPARSAQSRAALHHVLKR